MLPVFVLMSLIFTTISFFLLDLSTASANLVYMYIVIFTLFFAGNGFATFLSGFVPDALVGNGAGTAILAFMVRALLTKMRLVLLLKYVNM